MTSSDETWRIEREVLDAVLEWIGPDGRYRGPGDVVLGRAAERLHAAVTRDVTPVWIERTWRDVRQGDVIRPAGFPRHAARVENIERHAPGVRRFTMRPCDDGGSGDAFTRLVSNPDGAIEIRLSNGEVAAINALGGWEYREGVIWDA